ncbi:MAG: hypothetical protein CYPHOPRED_002902 [Cyphobasidiales sp. Tagirdzhanova-0007]|nr:MAG: hypothetical protein CYPHOPRED_002902 [Cyphobasidiales sp. Tagirdzhanova-0007]
MALNDHAMDMTKSTDIVSGLSNPTVSTNHANPKAANFVTDPGSDEVGAGHPPSWTGYDNASTQLRKNSQANDVEANISGTVVEPLGTDPGKAGSTKADGSLASALDSLEKTEVGK